MAETNRGAAAGQASQELFLTRVFQHGAAWVQGVDQCQAQ
jgi:hypothetical protein